MKSFTVEQRRRLLEVGIDLFIYTPDEFAMLVREKSPFIEVPG